MARARNFVPAFTDERPVRKNYMKMPITVVVATLETRKFTFEGAGTNVKEAQAALRQALGRHGQQYNLPANWFREYGYPANIDFRSLTTGAGYRDHEMITPTGKDRTPVLDM